MADVYLDSAATGGADGTSWADAYTAPNTAWADVSNDDTLHIRGDYVGNFTFAGSKTGVTIIQYSNITFDGNAVDNHIFQIGFEGTWRNDAGKNYRLVLTNGPPGKYAIEKNTGCDIDMQVETVIHSTALGIRPEGAAMKFRRLKIYKTSSNWLQDTSSLATTFEVGELLLSEITQAYFNNSNASTVFTLRRVFGGGGGTVFGVGSNQAILRTGPSFAGTINVFGGVIVGPYEPDTNAGIIEHSAGNMNFYNTLLHKNPLKAADDPWRVDDNASNFNEVLPLSGYAKYSTPRRQGYITLTVDDRANIDHFENLVSDAAEYGIKINIALDDLNNATAGNWTTLQTAVDAGHGVACHTIRETQFEGLDAIDIQYTGAGTCTLDIDVDGDSLTTSGSASSLLSITLSNHTNLQSLIAAINAVTDYTCTVNSTYGADFNNNASYESLADVIGQDITSSYTILLDAQRHYDTEVEGGKTLIEANLSNYTCDAFVYVGGTNDVSIYGDIFYAGNFYGARATETNVAGAGPYRRDQFTPFRAGAWRLSDVMGSSTPTRATVRQYIGAIVDWCNHEGIILDLYGHGNSEFSRTSWGYVFEALRDMSDINVVTLSQAYQAGRQGAYSNEGGGVHQWAKDFSNTDLTWVPRFEVDSPLAALGSTPGASSSGGLGPIRDAVS